jgi:hypothetical protein
MSFGSVATITGWMLLDLIQRTVAGTAYCILQKLQENSQRPRMIIGYITSLYQLLQFTWNKQDLGTIICSEIIEETAELGEYEKKLLKWENDRRNG